MEGRVTVLEFPEVLQEAIETGDGVVGGCRILAKNHHPLLPVLAVLLGAVADPKPRNMVEGGVQDSQPCAARERAGDGPEVNGNHGPSGDTILKVVKLGTGVR